jgi:hypothetical protein
VIYKFGAVRGNFGIDRVRRGVCVVMDGIRPVVDGGQLRIGDVHSILKSPVSI